MELRMVSIQNRQAVNECIKKCWSSLDMVLRGEIVDMTKMDGFAVYEDEEIAGLITYLIVDGECEIMSLNSLKPKKGIGTLLINEVINVARTAECRKIKLVTTNDNINAIYFYQKHGFDMVRLYHNALLAARKLKQDIPLLGDFDIPLKHELEFEMDL